MNRLKRALLDVGRRVIKPHHIRLLANYVAGPCELVAGPLTYNQDGLATIHSVAFIDDPRFREAYLQGKGTGSWGEANIQWRAYVACWAADKAKHLEGDFVECGVNRGGMARTVIDYVDFSRLNKKFYLLDTFNGLCEKYLSAGEKARDSHWEYEECYEAVKDTFRDFNVEIIRGTVPDTLPQVDARRVSFLSLDMNCALPEIAAAEFFWDKLVSGAVMVLDDYGWPDHAEQRIAFDRFAASKQVRVLPLPTGQGLIFKP